MAITSHLLVVSFPAWGHLRPLTVLVCKIIQQRLDIGITLLIAKPSLQQVQGEIEAILTKAAERDRIRVIDILEAFPNPSLGEVLTTVENAFEKIYDPIFNRRCVTCYSTGKVYDFNDWPIAKVIIADMALGIHTYVRSRSPNTHIFFFHSSSLALFLKPIIAMKGGVDGSLTKVKSGGQLSEEELTRLVKMILLPNNGDILDLPGIPQIYDYELTPQVGFVDIPSFVQFFRRIINFFNDADGILSVSSSTYEATSQEIYRSYLANSGRNFYAVGPLLSMPTPPGRNEAGSKSQVETFLNHTAVKYGKQSLLYISFGSIFWPSPEYLAKFIDILVEMEFPFILAAGSYRAVVPEDLGKRVKASNVGLIEKWCPQQLILNHEATGWFLTHCGQNSITEALCAGVPMITWPQEFDQPLNSIKLSLVHNVAYELHEVRTGEQGLKPLLRGIQPQGTLEAAEAEARRVLQAARGSDGEQKRKNIQAMAEKLNFAWEKRGEASMELGRFLTKELSLA